MIFDLDTNGLVGYLELSGHVQLLQAAFGFPLLPADGIFHSSLALARQAFRPFLCRTSSKIFDIFALMLDIFQMGIVVSFRWVICRRC